jgi:hypothetical protein
MTNFIIENDVMDFSESIITRENIDKQLNHYATLLTVLMALKEKFEAEDDREFDSDAESLIDTDDTWTTSDDDSDNSINTKDIERLTDSDGN